MRGLMLKNPGMAIVGAGIGVMVGMFVGLFGASMGALIGGAIGSGGLRKSPGEPQGDDRG